jgi:hypothetical protein
LLRVKSIKTEVDETNLPVGAGAIWPAEAKKKRNQAL